MTDQVTFNATLTDNVTPRLEKLEKQLQAMGQHPIQIRMTLEAVDAASKKTKEAKQHIDQIPKQTKTQMDAMDNITPKIKNAQKEIEKLPKRHIINLDVRGGFDKLKEEFDRTARGFTKPITLPFRMVDQEGKDLRGSMNDLFRVRSKIALPLMGAIPGSNMLYGVGAGAGIAGAITGVGGVMQDSFKINAQMESQQQMLAQTLKDQQGAAREMQKIVAYAQTTPFQYTDVLKANVLARSYGMPSLPGESKQVPQGFLKIASNMAATMQTSPEDAMMALAEARQGLSRRMLMYGVHMQSRDFGPGGRFQGMSYDQALGLSTKRFQGATTSQMQTFSGISSNIKDVVQQQILKPVGAALFAAIEHQAFHVADRLSQSDVQAKIGQAVEKIQHLTITIIQDLQKVKEYFDTHLKQPIENVISAVTKLGRAFGMAFGGTTAIVVQTFSNAMMAIAEPIVMITKAIPGLGQALGFMKAMQLLGLGGSAKPVNTVANALNPLSSASPFSAIKAIPQLPGMAFKMAGLAVIKDLVDASRASSDMNNQFSQMGGHLDTIHRQTSAIAMALGESKTHMEKLVAAAAEGIPIGRMAPSSRANLAIQTARSSFQISHITGLGAHDVSRALDAQMRQTQQYSVGAMHEFGTQIIALSAVAKELKTSWSDAMRVMQEFASQATPIGLGGTKGAPALLALSQGVNQYGVTKGQIGQGFYTPDSVLRQMLTSYKTPLASDLGQVGVNNIGKYWQFANRPGAIKRWTTNANEFNLEYAGSARAQQEARKDIAKYAPTTLSAVPTVTEPWMTSHLGVDLKGLQGTNAVQTAQNVGNAWLRTAKNVNEAQKQYGNLGAVISLLQSKVESYTQAQQALDLQMQAAQHAITLLQRGVEDAQLAMQKYTFDNLRPLERELTRVSQAMDVVNHSMSDAQYNMTKFADGLVTGEQAALNQLHALSLYNEQLNYLKMQYTTIGAQLGTKVYERGFSARVAPLMGLSLEMQMQQLQRKQQMEQSKYDITYGEDHYQMQQAQRSKWQRTEMPLGVRLKNIKENQSVIDKTTIQAHNLGNVQFALQEKMFKVNEVIANQTDSLTKLQLAVQTAQQSPAMRQLEDEQFRLGQKIGKTNIEITKQQSLQGKWQNVLTDLRQQAQDLQNLFSALIQFPEGAAAAFTTARRSVKESAAAGLIKKPEEDYLLKIIDKAEKAAKKAEKGSWWDKPASVEDIIKRAIIGAFTGDLFRKLGDMVKGIPGIGGPLSTGLHVAGDIAPVVATVAASLVASGGIMWGLKRIVARLVPGSIKDIAGESLSHLGTLIQAATKGRFGEGLVALGAPGALQAKLTGSLGTTIAEKFKPFLHPIKEWQRFIGRGVGTAVGFAINPALAYPGGRAGEAAMNKVFSKGSKDILSGAGTIKTAAKDAAHNVVKEKENIATRFKNAVKVAGEENTTAGKMARVADRFGSHIGRFGRFMGKFGAIVGAIDLLKNFLSHLPGVHAPRNITRATRDASRVGKAVSNTAADTKRAIEDAGKMEKILEEHPILKRGVEAARKAGAKGFEYAGKFFKFSSKAFGVASFIPAASELMKGHVGKAIRKGADALTYFVPGLGAVRVIDDISQAALGKHQGPLGVAHAEIKALTNIGSNPNKEPIAQKVLNWFTGGTWESPQDKAQAKIVNQAMKGGKTPWNKGFLAGLLSPSTDDFKKDKVAIDKYHSDVQKKRQEHNAKMAYLQQQAQTGALNGPAGTVQALSQQKQILVDHWNRRETFISNAYVAEAQTHTAGFRGIASITQGWLAGLSKAVDHWAKSMGLPLSKGEKSAASGAPAITPTQSAGINAGLAALRSFEHGGMVHADKHKIGPGRVVRMVEEGHDEMVIPLAPHRRDRARSLIEHTKGLIGYASGGKVSAHTGQPLERSAGGGAGTQNASTMTAPPGTESHLQRLIAAANRVSAANFPYVWGGGHQASPAPFGPFDCSGAVSYAVQQAGYGVPTSTSGQMGNLGFPRGPGRATIFYNPVHTFMRIMGKYWGTSGFARPGGGAGWFNQVPGAGYLSGFNTVHLPDLGGSGGMKPMSGAGGALASLSGASLDMPAVPRALRGMGLIGAMQYAILVKHAKKWKSHLTQSVGSVGTGFAGGALGNPNRVSGKFSGNQKAFISTLATLTGLSPRVVGAWVGAEEPIGSSSGYRGTQDWLNVGITDSGPMGAGNSVWTSAPSAARATAAWIKGTWSDPGFGKASGRIQGILNAVHQSPTAQMMAIANSGWASSGYNGGRNLISLYNQGYAGGWPRVSQDGVYPLHRDEAVLPVGEAHAWRAGATRGTRPKAKLGDDQAWLTFYNRFVKVHNTAVLIQEDIHKMQKKITADTPTQKKADTEKLAALNASLRAANAAFKRTQTHMNNTIAKSLIHTGDTSGGENTVAGVAQEKTLLNKIVSATVNTALHSKSYVAAINQLRKDLAAYNKLYAKVHAKGHHETAREKRELSKLHRRVVNDRRHIAGIVSGAKTLGQHKYIVSAAERGVNAGLIKAITGRGLNKQQLAAYKRLENAVGHHGKATVAQLKAMTSAQKAAYKIQEKAYAKHIKDLEKALMKSLDTSTKKQVAEHKKSQSSYKAHTAAVRKVGSTTDSHIKAATTAAKTHGAVMEKATRETDTHQKKHQTHMDKTEKHQSILEKKLDSLISKSNKQPVVNLVVNVSGTKVTLSPTKGTPRAKSK